MRSDVQLDWAWADGHMRAIVDVLKANAMHLLSVSVASEQRDLKRATDLVVTVDGGSVAVRIRRNSYHKKYRDLTLRAWRKSGVKTEIDKIRDGFADWYLYCWSDGNGGLADWMLVDLNKVRARGLLDSLEDRRSKGNKDGRTGFTWLTDAELRQHECMVAEWQATPQLQLAFA